MRLFEHETLTVFKDYAQILGPILSPVIAAVTAILLYKTKEQERVHGVVEWKYIPHPDGQYEQPCFVVHNRSDRSIAIKELLYYSGMCGRRRSETTALDFYDPEDIDFPYLIEPSKIYTLPLDSEQAVRIAEDASSFARLLSRAGRPRIWIQATTTGGKRVRISAETVIPWKRRPTWLQV